MLLELLEMLGLLRKGLGISERQAVLVLGGRFYALTLVAHGRCHVEYLIWYVWRMTSPFTEKTKVQVAEELTAS